MNKCAKCGKENNEKAIYCSGCGSDLKTKFATASLIIGIISLILSFTCVIFIPMFITIPLSIIGLVLGIVNVIKTGKKYSGIIINSLSIGISFVLGVFVAPFVFSLLGIGAFGALINEAAKDGSDVNKALNHIYNEIERETSTNYVKGDYNCKSYNVSNGDNEYLFSLNLDSNDFLYAKYQDKDNNYLKGTYTFNDLEKTNNSGEYKYYKIVLNASEFYQDGIKQATPQTYEYEFGITAKNTKKEGILMNTKTYNMYYCYEE